ncbi:MAG: Hsp20/alpha crystallin family protein [Thermodesulfobacteriota bacterium]|nr:Hsp20/alpha crystallin family protein [Thermodesulfobacteriota bacterium]
MAELTTWKDKEMSKLKRDIDHLFKSFWSDFGANLFVCKIAQEPLIDIIETPDTLVVKAELHDTNPEELDISVTADTLILKREKSEETVEDSTYFSRVQRRSGFFSRTIRLPKKVMVEGIRASYKEGVLEIVMPKAKPEKPRVIKVEVK